MQERREPASRRCKILWISQAHLEPGLNLTTWQAFIDQYGLMDVTDWDRLSDEDLDAMITELHRLASQANSPEQLPSQAGSYAWEIFLGDNEHVLTE